MPAESLPSVRDDPPMRLAASLRLRTLVADRIREAIASLRFPPGKRLVERELCEMFGVSRTSVREGLRELESEGLISTRGGRPMVAVLTREEMQEVYEVRTALEGLAARLFVRNADEAQHARLAEAAAALFHTYAEHGPSSYLQAKGRVYDVLLEGSANAVAASMLRVIHTKVSVLRATSLSVPQRVQASAREIEAIVVAINARDEEAADRLTVKHIENAWAAALAVHRAGGADRVGGFGGGQAGFAPAQEAASPPA